MSFFEAVAACLSRYADFKGRASRAEFWWFLLFILLASILLNQLTMSFFGQSAANVVSSIFSLAMVVPTISVSTRRLHDMNHTGWWQLLSFLGVGTLILLIWFMFPGTKDANRFGQPPPSLDD
jgi:uncharacterized membrane protein YhaH (DUF805 family)